MVDVMTLVERTIREEGLLLTGDRLVAAVSGGPDSVAMLHVLHRLTDSFGWSIIVAHLNHQFRGEESDAEARFVEQLAASLGLACETARIDVPELIRRTGRNAQETAREARYRFLRQAAELHGADKLALAHHADDQAETVLMRLLRGAGSAGLAGMPMRRREGSLELIRPLLRIYKQDLMDLCRHQGWAYCTDSSNAQTKYVRNRIRLQVMPLLQEFNPQIPQTLNRLAELIGQDNDYMERDAQRIVDDWRQGATGRYTLPRKDFLCLHVALQRRCIKLILKYVFSDGDFSDYTTVEAVRDALLQDTTPSLRLHLPGGCSMEREYDRVIFSRESLDSATQPAPSPQQLTWIDGTGSGIVQWAEGIAITWRLEEMTRGDTLQSLSAEEAVFDADALRPPLRLRARKPGDRMEVLGLKGSKKVKAMLIDDKVPRSLRERIPVLADDDGTILWIPGVRRSIHALVDDCTTRVLYMKVFIEWMDFNSHSIQ